MTALFSGSCDSPKTRFVAYNSLKNGISTISLTSGWSLRAGTCFIPIEIPWHVPGGTHRDHQGGQCFIPTSVPSKFCILEHRYDFCKGFMLKVYCKPWPAYHYNDCNDSWTISLENRPRKNVSRGNIFQSFGSVSIITIMAIRNWFIEIKIWLQIFILINLYIVHECFPSPFITSFGFLIIEQRWQNDSWNCQCYLLTFFIFLNFHLSAISYDKLRIPHSSRFSEIFQWLHRCFYIALAIW